MIAGRLTGTLKSRQQGSLILEHFNFSELQPKHWLHIQLMPSAQIPSRSPRPPQGSSGPWKREYGSYRN